MGALWIVSVAEVAASTCTVPRPPQMILRSELPPLRRKPQMRRRWHGTSCATMVIDAAARRRPPATRSTTTRSLPALAQYHGGPRAMREDTLSRFNIVKARQREGLTSTGIGPPQDFETNRG